jgi:hypothetical protein
MDIINSWQDSWDLVITPVVRTLHYKTKQTEKNADIRASSKIRTHDPTVRAGKDISCLRQRGHCDRKIWNLMFIY